MFENLTREGVTIALALISLAALAVFLSRNAKTTQVIQALSQGLNSGIAAATAPITGGNNFSLNTPTFGNYGF